MVTSVLQRELDGGKERTRFLVGLRCRGDGDVQAPQTVDLVVLDLAADAAWSTGRTTAVSRRAPVMGRIARAGGRVGPARVSAGGLWPPRPSPGMSTWRSASLPWPAAWSPWPPAYFRWRSWSLPWPSPC